MEHPTGAKIGLEVLVPANQGSMGGQETQDVQDSFFHSRPPPLLQRTTVYTTYAGRRYERAWRPGEMKPTYPRSPV